MKSVQVFKYILTLKFMATIRQGIRTEIVRLEPNCVLKKLVRRLCNLLPFIHLREVVIFFSIFSSLKLL
jgi:hypothetical protein